MTKLKCLKCGKKFYYHKWKETKCPIFLSKEYVDISGSLETICIACIIISIIVITPFLFFFSP